MRCLDNFKNRIGNNGVTDIRSSLTWQAEKEFEHLLRTNPTALDIKVTDVDEVNITDKTKTIRCIINDYSDNDQKSFDEKWLLVRKDENVDIGCYVEFDNCYWLVNFKEHKSINSNKKFIMKKCNQIIRYKFKDEIYDIPVVAKNLTQYSDGMQDIVYTSMPDNKLSLLYGVNYVTKNIKLGQRVMIDKSKVYRTTMVEDFQYNGSYDKEDGIASAIVVFTALRGTDDRDNNIADNEEGNDVIGLSINGSDRVMPGGKFKYSIDNTNVDWKVIYNGMKEKYVNLEKNNGECLLHVESDMNLIGESFRLISINNADNQQIKKEISVTGF